MNTGSWWRGRRIGYDPDKQAIEQERQQWVTEQIAKDNVLFVELAPLSDPDRAYAQHRARYEETGDPAVFRLMLEYVR